MTAATRFGKRLWSLAPFRDGLFFTLVAWFVVAPWTRRGYLLLLDWTVGPTSTLSNATYGLASDQADSMPVRIALSVLRHTVGAGAAGWLPIMIALVGAGVGAAALAGGGGWRRRAAGMAFVINPFVFERLRAGHVYVLLGMAVLPWLVASALAAKRNGSMFRVRTAAVFALAIACSPHMFWIGLVALAAVTFTNGVRRNDVVRLGLTLVAAAATMAYALALQAVGVHTVTVGNADLTAYGTRGGGGLGTLADVLTLHGFWRSGSTPASWWGVLWPVVVAVAVLIAIRGLRLGRAADAATRGLVVPVRTMAIAGALLACGVAGPTGWLFRLMFDHLPLFQVMREPQKFAMLVALAWSLAFGVAADSLAPRVLVPAMRTARLAAWCLLPLVTAPTLLWGLGGQVQVSHYPASWTAAEATMGSGTGGILMLPWHQYQPYSFSAGRTVRVPGAAFFERPVVTSDATEMPGLRSASLSPRSTYLDRVMARSASVHHLGRLVAALDVQYVVATVDTSGVGATSSGAANVAWLDRQVDLKVVLHTADLVVYENLAKGTGRVVGSRTVGSFDEYVNLVESGAIGNEAVFVDPTVVAATATRSDTAGGVTRTSPTTYAVGAGTAGWVVVPTPAASGWALQGDGGRATVQGVLAFAAGAKAASVSYAPWYVVRRGYLISFLALVALFVVGVLEHRRPIAQSRLVAWMAARLRLLWARFRRGTAPPYVFVWLVASFAVNSWFNAGAFVSTGDMGPFIRRGWQPEAWWSWNHAITGGGSAAYVMSRWYEFLLVGVVHGLGGSDTLSQRLFYLTIYPMVALAVAACVATFTRNRIAIAAAGSFAVLNGFFLTRLPNPLNIISVGCVAMVAAVGFRVAQGKRLPAPLLGLAMLMMSFLTYNPPMLVVAFVWTGLGVPLVAAVIWGRKAIVRIAKYALTAAPWALLINLFWLIPFAQAFTGGGGASATAQTDPTAWAWSQAQNNVPNVLTMAANWAWYKPQYLPFTPTLDQPAWIWLRYLLPVLVLASPVLVLQHRRRAALSLASLVAVFAVLAKGLQPPFSSFNALLYKVVPGFWLFREPMSKLGQLLVLFEAVLLALSIEGVIVRTRHLRRAPRRITRTPLTIAMCGVLAWPFPLITGSVIPDSRPMQPSAHVVVPSFWRTTASMIDADTTEGKVLVLPLDDYYQMPTTWGFSGVDSIAGLLLHHPVLQRHPDGYFGDVPGLAVQIDAVEKALTSGDLTAVQPLLRSLGVRWIILRHDLVLGDPLRTFQDPALLGSSLGRIPGLTLVQNGSLDVYEVKGGAVTTVRAGSTPLVVPNTPAAIADAVASLPAGSSVTATGKSTAAADLVPGKALSATDGVWWAVPTASTKGDVNTTFTSTGGNFTVNQRSRASVPMVLTEVADPTSPSGKALRLTDPTSVLVDGTTVSQRTPTQYPLLRSGVVAAQVGSRAVSLDAWSAASQPTGTNAADGVFTVPVGAASSLTAWSLASSRPKVGAHSDVYDCNNYEPRPASELQLSATTITDAAVTGGTTPVTRLSANDHAACVRYDVGGITAGDTVRIRVEYRTVEGKRPQVCLLETLKSGGERCVFDERLRASNEWGRYEIIHTVASDVVSISVVLYANVGLRLSPRTVSDYRNVTVQHLTTALQTTVWPGNAPVTTVQLTPGTHTMTLRGGAYGSLLAPFEPLEDCFRYDDQSVAEAGLSATVTDDSGERQVDGQKAFAANAVIELRAKAHMACLASTMPDYGGAGMYELRYDYRSVAVRKPKVAIYHRGPNISEPLPANGSQTVWSTFTQALRPYVASVETRLYLYGPRDLTGTSQAIVQYRDVSVEAVASSSTVSLLRVQTPATTTATTTTATVRSTRTSPASYDATVTVDATPVIVALGDTVAPGWMASKNLPAGVTAKKVTLNGWQNGWIVTNTTGAPVTVTLRLRYAPAFLARTALKLSAVGLFMALVWILLLRRRARQWWSARRRRRGGWRRRRLVRRIVLSKRVRMWSRA